MPKPLTAAQFPKELAQCVLAKAVRNAAPMRARTGRANRGAKHQVVYSTQLSPSRRECCAGSVASRLSDMVYAAFAHYSCASEANIRSPAARFTRHPRRMLAGLSLQERRADRPDFLKHAQWLNSHQKQRQSKNFEILTSKALFLSCQCIRSGAPPIAYSCCARSILGFVGMRHAQSASFGAKSAVSET